MLGLGIVLLNTSPLFYIYICIFSKILPLIKSISVKFHENFDLLDFIKTENNMIQSEFIFYFLFVDVVGFLILYPSSMKYGII